MIVDEEETTDGPTAVLPQVPPAHMHNITHLFYHDANTHSSDNESEVNANELEPTHTFPSSHPSHQSHPSHPSHSINELSTKEDEGDVQDEYVENDAIVF